MRRTAEERREVLLVALDSVVRLCNAALYVYAIYVACHFIDKYW